jgi:hypothetical protein
MVIQDTSKTKIIATVRPASSSKKKLRALIESEIDVCRLNFSHGNYKEYEGVIQRIRKLNADIDRHVFRTLYVIMHLKRLIRQARRQLLPLHQTHKPYSGLQVIDHKQLFMPLLLTYNL